MSSLKLGSGLCFDRPRRLSSLAGGGGDFIRAALFDNDRIERVTQPELLRRGSPNPNPNPLTLTLILSRSSSAAVV